METRFRDLVLTCISTNPLTAFPLAEVSDELSAAAATFWLRDSYDDDSMTLRRWHNRPDLDVKRSMSFLLGDSFASRWKESLETPYLFATREEMVKLKWSNSYLKDYSTSHYDKFLFICLHHRNEISGLLSLYFNNQSDYPDEEYVIDLAAIVGAHIYCMGFEVELLTVERRKIGHELARMISQARIKFNKLKGRIRNSTHMQNNILDLEKALSSAHEAASKATFIEGVRERRRYAKRLSLRREALAAFHLTLTKYGKSYNDIVDNRIPWDADIYFSEDDLALLLSNVASNAMKYTVDKGDISMSLEAFGDRTELTVSNTSSPMSTKDKEKIWRFGARGDNARDIEGEGIGLSIISDICSVYNIERSLTQSKRAGAVWTDLVLSFPPSVCRRR